MVFSGHLASPPVFLGLTLSQIVSHLYAAGSSYPRACLGNLDSQRAAGSIPSSPRTFILGPSHTMSTARMMIRIRAWMIPQIEISEARFAYLHSRPDFALTTETS